LLFWFSFGVARLDGEKLDACQGEFGPLRRVINRQNAERLGGWR
jgi:hypothetical protein